MRVLTVSLELQEDNYGPEDDRLFVQNYEGVPNVTVSVPAENWREELDRAVDVTIQITNPKVNKS